MDENPGRLQSIGSQESGTAERLKQHRSSDGLSPALIEIFRSSFNTDSGIRV